MSKLSPQEMATILAKGLLSFPVTHFDKDFRFQEGPYREHCAWLLGFKDGVGDIEKMMRVYAKLGDRLTYVGGLPTAETFALPYLEMGVTTYSSAIYNFMPEWALSFYDAVRAKDHAKVMKGLKEFVLPYIAIRNENRGYAVSIVKAGMTAIGRGAGPVRPPLTELSPDQVSRLKRLIDTAKPV